MASLKPYPKMKDTAVTWLGEVPAHWHVSRLRNMAEMRVSNVDKHSRATETAVRLCNYVDVYHNERITSGLPFMHATATAGEIERFGLRQGDVLITKDSETWNDIGVPALVEETAPGVVVGYHLAILRPYLQSTHPGYLLRALQSTAIASQFHVRANGVTRFGLTRSAIKAIRIPAPPLAEQAAISRFLDQTVNRIQRYVSAKQRLIALLVEQKRATISQVVTGQIDVRTGEPYAAYQPSRIGASVDVPAHWDVRRLKYIATVNPGWSKDGHRPAPDDCVTFLPMERVGADGRIDTQEILTASAVGSGFTTFRRGDILVAKITPCFENGKGADLRSLPTRFGAGSTEFHVLRARSPVLPHFLYRATTAVDFRVRGANAMTGAAGQQRVPSSFIADYPIALPPLREQAEIVSFLERFVANLERRIESASRLIGLVRELSSRLIADAVTGGVDVRDRSASICSEPTVAATAAQMEEAHMLASNEAQGRAVPVRAESLVCPQGLD